MRAIFDERNVPKELQQKLLDYYYKTLGKAVDVGYKPTIKHYDTELANSLKKNIAEFSAFKEVSFRNSLLEILEKKGTLPTWNEFRSNALETSKLYNVNWLKTEYHQTVATANMARKWQDFERTKELYPNLKYVTVGDDRVRDKHKKWDGFIAPIDHPIWKKLLPPNDWGCRCDVVRTDEAPTKGYATFTPPIKQGFENNPALSGAIFKDQMYANGLSTKELIATTQRAILYLHKNSSKELKHFVERAVYELPRTWQFKEVYANGKGKVLQHLLVSETAEDFNEVLQSAKAFANKNSVAELLPIINDKSVLKYRKKVFPKYEYTTNPDLRINDIYMDVKRVSSIKKIVRNANKASKNQQSIAVIFVKENVHLTDTVMQNRVADIFDKKNRKNYFFRNSLKTCGVLKK